MFGFYFCFFSFLLKKIANLTIDVICHTNTNIHTNNAYMHYACTDTKGSTTAKVWKFPYFIHQNVVEAVSEEFKPRHCLLNGLNALQSMQKGQLLDLMQQHESVFADELDPPVETFFFFFVKTIVLFLCFIWFFSLILKSLLFFVYLFRCAKKQMQHKWLNFWYAKTTE